MAKRPNILLENVAVTGWGAKGKALARVDGLVVFVTGAVPGDVADLEVLRKKKNFAEARVKRMIAPSPNRVEPFCAHFGVCGGCTWQDLSYPEQAAFKRTETMDHLERLGGLDLPEVPPTLVSPHTTHYRNKLEYTFSNSRWFTTDELATMGEIKDRNALGFHVPGRFDKVFNVDTCWLQPAPSDAIRNFIRAYATEQGLSFYDIRRHEGWLRTLTIRTATTGEVMVLLAVAHEDGEALTRLFDTLLGAFPGIISLLWCVNPKKNDTIWDLDVQVYHGRDHIIEELPDGPDGRPLRFRIGPKTFFQTNPEQTLAMYRTIRDLAGLTGRELVYDLYSGAGSISLFVSGGARRVIGAEIVPDAVRDAFDNAALNGITNCHFEAGDLRLLLDASFAERHGRPDVIITDPPRAGMHPDVVSRIRELLPERIVYVSCDPTTQARDLALLKDLYRITHVQPVDMFPHTHHVENVVRLELSAPVEQRPDDGKVAG